MDQSVFPCWVCILACGMKRNCGSWIGLPTVVYIILYIWNVTTYHIKYKNTEFSVKKINLVVAGDIVNKALEVVCLFLAVPHTPIEVCLDTFPYGM